MAQVEASDSPARWSLTVVSDQRSKQNMSGKAVVIGLALLGILSTWVMFTYWELHTRPFRPLREALGRTFKYSLPQVDGGRRKGGPETLRIVLRVPFTPLETSVETQQFLHAVADVTRKHINLDQYERFELHLIQMRPEHDPVHHTFVYDYQTFSSL